MSIASEFVGLPDYGNGTKQTWRGWAWNQIAKRMPPYIRRDAVCLYLCGPEDIDRRHGTKHGFSNQNMIAVDISKDFVGRVNKSGGIAIRGHLADLIFAWPASRSLSVIIADFTCGMTRSTEAFYKAIEYSQGLSENTVVCVNLLRGRDASSNSVRKDILDETREDHEGGRYTRELFGSAGSELHRGAMFLIAKARWQWDHGEAAMQRMARMIGEKELREIRMKCGWSGISPTDDQKIIGPLKSDKPWRFYSYKSGSQRFDTVVYTNRRPGEESVCNSSLSIDEHVSQWQEIRTGYSEAGRKVVFRKQSAIASHARLTALINRKTEEIQRANAAQEA